jgi:hypothetical protein
MLEIRNQIGRRVRGQVILLARSSRLAAQSSNLTLIIAAFTIGMGYLKALALLAKKAVFQLSNLEKAAVCRLF